MNVKCDKCNTPYDIDESRLKKGGARFRCAKCGKTFSVSAAAEKAEAAPAGPGVPAVPAAAAGGNQAAATNVSEELLELNRDLHQRMERGAMPRPEEPPTFRIVKNDSCPLYELADEFQLSGRIFRVPAGKAPCLILAKDVVSILQKADGNADPDAAFRCSGCVGRIMFSLKKHQPAVEAEKPKGKPDSYIGAVVNLLSSFSIFKNLSEPDVRDLVSFLRLDKFSEDDIIIRKGEPGRNLFIVVSGKVEVVSEDGMSIAFMGAGEVFGEMSLLSGDPVGATIKVVDPTTVLYIGAKDFKRVLNEMPSLQLNFTRLLARRMAEINLARSEEFASGMTGKLSEMPPAELFQTLNVNQKTGVLTLKMPRESAYLSFREGELISARYRNKDGEEAFFELLKIKEGRFKFIPGLSPEEMEAPELGDFMHLLMEGLRKIDEDDKNFLKTMIPNLTS